MGECEQIDVAVIGAGVVGLAIGAELARAGRSVIVLETERQFGTHTSARNSEVIHAGMYYPAGSLKAQLCVRGRHLLYDYCIARGVAHEPIGKLIVASAESDLAALRALKQRGIDNGVDDLAIIDSEGLRALEPSVRGAFALLSPSTGIVDSHGLMQALRGDLERHGGSLSLQSRVTGGRIRTRGIELDVMSVEPTRLLADSVVNAAGPWAPDVARSIEGFPAAHVPRAHFAKGHYFTLDGPSPFRRLIYPLPVPGGLGTHATLDLAGRTRFGPDVSWVDDIEYRFDEDRAAAFYRAIRVYFPSLRDDSLSPGYVGVRPKLAGPSVPFSDFLIQPPSVHGVPGLIHLFGIESPGLTASLAIAQHVVGLI